MPAVNWDQPSSGLVSDPAPSLTLRNDQGLGLRTLAAMAPAGLFRSDEFVGVIAQAPLSTAVLGANRANAVAIAGGSMSDPNLPPQQSSGGIGVAGITDRFDALGVAGIALGPRSVGVRGSAVISGTGVIGTGTNAGVEGTASAGTGVAGFALGGSANTEGVFGQGTLLAAGVRGEAAGGPGVDAHASAGPAVQALADQNHGVVAQTNGKGASGVLGVSGDGAGIDGFSLAGNGVRAVSETGAAVQATSIASHAVDALTLGSDDAAVRAAAVLAPALAALALTGTGIRAFGTKGVDALAINNPNDPESGIGVAGRVLSGTAPSAAGVLGVVSGSGVGVVGVGDADLGALAGRFNGNVLVTGDLETDGAVDADHIHAGDIEAGFIAAALKLFVIDHPLDPKRKILRHACVEAPEYKTFYDGTVTLNARGQARVPLPRWFSALNAELRYQLTPLGRGAPDLHVATPFTAKAGAFIVAGGHPGQSVCWQVTAIRHDAAARATPLKVEDRKPSRRPARRPKPDGGVAREVAALTRGSVALKARAAAIKKEVTDHARAARARKAPTAIPAPAPREPSPPSTTVAKALDDAQQAIRRHAERA